MNKRTKRLLAMMSAKPKLRTVSGLPPLSYKAKKAGTLSNYRIYGNTLSGESVGDRTGNLFDKDDPDILDGYEIRETNIVVRQSYFVTNFISVNAETSYITNDVNIGGFSSDVLEYDSSKQLIRRNLNSSYNGFTTTNTTAYIKLNGKIESKDTCMLVKGNTVPSIYEPYGYKVPVTVSNGTDAQTIPIYLSEQIRKVGDEAEYIDYGEQKQHRVRKNLANNKHTRSLVNYTITENDNYIHVVGTNTTSNTQAIILSNFVDLEAGEYDLVNNSSATIHVDYYDENGIAKHFNVPSNSIKTFTYPSNVTRALNVYRAITAGNSIDAYFQVMIVKHGNDTTIYEPYIENTELDVILPALPTLAGTNTLSVGTTVQPSAMEVTGRIKSAE